MLVFGWTLKLFLEHRISTCEFASHRDPLELCICLYCVVYLPMKGLLQRCLCVRCFWNLIKFPIERFIIFSRQRRENYKPINPHVWYSSPFLPLCLLPSLFYVSSFYLASSPQAHHVCDVGRSFVSMLQLSCPPACPVWPSWLLIIIQICEHLQFSRLMSFLCVFNFSLFIKDIYIHVCLYWPVWLRPSFLVTS